MPATAALYRLPEEDAEVHAEAARVGFESVSRPQPLYAFAEYDGALSLWDDPFQNTFDCTVFDGSTVGDVYRGRPVIRLESRILPGGYLQPMYRGYSIRFDPKPIPLRQFDWDYCHRDYDGEGDLRCGNAGSVAECIAEIDEIEAELAEREEAA